MLRDLQHLINKELQADHSPDNLRMNAIADRLSHERPTFSLRHVVLVAVAIRILLPLLAFIVADGDPQFRDRDTGSYIRPAVSLVSDGEFSAHGEPEILRTPGYPIFLIPAIASGHVETVTIVLQIAVSTLTVVLVYKIALLLFERSEIAILSALLYALEPLSILYSSKLLSETLFSALIALFLFLLLSYIKRGSLIYLVGSAATLAASAYVRPIAYYLPFLICIVLLTRMFTKKKMNWQRLAHAAIFLLVAFGLIGLWQIRNRIETGYTGFSSAAEHSLYFWDAASVLAEVEGIPVDEMKAQMGLYDDEIYFRNFPEQRGLERGEVFMNLGRQGVEIIVDNFGTYAVLAIEGTLRTLIDPAANEYLRMFRLYPFPIGGLNALIIERGPVEVIDYLLRESQIVFWAVLFFGLVLISNLLLAAIGVVRYRMVSSPPVVLFAVVTIYFLALSAAGIGDSRARHPIMPIICVFSGYGLFWVTRNLRAKWSPRRAKLIPST